MQFPKFNLQEFEKSEGAQRQNLSVQLDNICRNTGFLVLDGHGVSSATIATQWKVVSDFFALPNAKKQEVAVPYAGYPYGWIGPNKEALAASKGEKTPPDLKESFNGGPLTIPVGIKDVRAYDFCYKPTIWPQFAISRLFGRKWMASKRLGVNIIVKWRALLSELCRHLLKL